MATIFILEVSALTREQVAECLLKKNHRVQTFDAIAVLEEVRVRRVPDLLILEARLSDGDGVEWVSTHRKKPFIPVIFLTHCSSALERMRGFEAGADDYVVKPFSAQELALRAEAILRRYNRGLVRDDPISRIVRLPCAG